MTSVDTEYRLDRALRVSGLTGLIGVVVGDIADRSTWRVQPEALQVQAQPIIDAYADPTPEQLADEEAERETTNKRIMAVALALWECIPAPTMTKAQLRSRAKAIYKGLV
jgi:hypothetical protein